MTYQVTLEIYDTGAVSRKVTWRGGEGFLSSETSGTFDLVTILRC